MNTPSFKKITLMCLLASCGMPSYAMSSFSSLAASLQTAFTNHPIIVTSASLAALYGVSYGLNYLLYNNKPVHVELIDTTSNPQTSHENFLFAHGIAESHEQAYWYTKGKSTLPHVIDGRLFTYDFPDSTKRFWRVNFTQTGLGQYNEIMGLKSAYEQAIAKLDAHENVILIGVSRGASTVINFMGIHQPERIKALILESPFYSTRDLTNNIARAIRLDQIPGVATTFSYVMSGIFWQHTPNGIQAKNNVAAIAKDLPILLIGTKNDTLVPLESTIALYRALRQSGHTNVHIYIADHGKHTRILHGADGQNYQAVVHAFYKQYGIAHDAQLADMGEELFLQCQPE